MNLNGLGWFIISQNEGAIPPPPEECFILLQDGSEILLQNGKSLAMQSCANNIYLTTENGERLLQEDGSPILAG